MTAEWAVFNTVSLLVEHRQHGKRIHVSAVSDMRGTAGPKFKQNDCTKSSAESSSILKFSLLHFSFWEKEFELRSIIHVSPCRTLPEQLSNKSKFVCIESWVYKIDTFFSIMYFDEGFLKIRTRLYTYLWKQDTIFLINVAELIIWGWTINQMSQLDAECVQLSVKYLVVQWPLTIWQ